jgi:hypothetical protein
MTLSIAPTTTYLFAQSLQLLRVDVRPDTLHVVPVGHNAVGKRISHFQQAAEFLCACSDEDIALPASAEIFPSENELITCSSLVTSNRYSTDIPLSHRLARVGAWAGPQRPGRNTWASPRRRIRRGWCRYHCPARWGHCAGLLKPWLLWKDDEQGKKRGGSEEESKTERNLSRGGSG